VKEFFVFWIDPRQDAIGSRLIVAKEPLTHPNTTKQISTMTVNRTDRTTANLIG